jgi:hypothetical protein
MPKAKEGNIYDLVERGAARRNVPQLELWEKVLKALIEEDLRPLNLSISEKPNPVAAPAVTYSGYFNDILRAVVDRRFDPSSAAYIFRKIIVRCADFESLLRKGNIGGRGPKPEARHVPTIAAPLSRRKSAIVLKLGTSRRRSHITSTL